MGELPEPRSTLKYGHAMGNWEYFLLGSLTALIIVAGILAVLGSKTDSRPLYVRQERNIGGLCDDIIRYEDGSLVCEIDLQAEDDAAPQNVRSI